jgi:HK97 family phage prohead protease
LTDFHYIRAFPSTVTATLTPKGRQLTGRLVPYDTVADVLDELPDGKLDIYREGFRRGAFAPQVGSREKGVVNRIGLVHRHEGGLGYLGPFVALRDEPDGLWGDVTVLPTKADDVGTLLEAGITELSIEFRLPRGTNTVEQDGIRWRTKAHLDAVALEPRGAYRQAQVLAYRAEADDLARAAKEEEDRLAAEAAAAEAQQAEAAERRRKWDELLARIPKTQSEQGELLKTYGVTRPGGLGTVR